MKNNLGYALNSDESERKETIKILFQDRFNIKLLDIKEISNPESLTSPDFKFIKDGKTIFIAELKTFIQTRPTENEPLGYKRVGKFWEKSDNTPSKVAGRIKKAYSQLERYKKFPKIIMFLNESIDVDHIDLKSALTGKISFYDDNSNEEILELYEHISNGEINKIKSGIDLYIWIDAPSYMSRPDFEIKFFYTNKIGECIIKDYFST